MQRDEMIKISLLVSPEAEAKIDALTTEQLRAFVSSDAPNQDKKRYAQFVLDSRLEKETLERRRLDFETKERRHREMVEALNKRPPVNAGNIIFISCGQYGQEEKALGNKVASLVSSLTPFQPYFAENQNSLEGLSKNVFGKLNEACGLITIMHHRGRIQTPEGDKIRASVWIEQEIAIAVFLQQIYERKMYVKAFAEEGINLEGIREVIQLNPKMFKNGDEILSELERELPTWLPFGEELKKEKSA